MPSLRGDLTAAFAQETLTRQGLLWVREATASMLPLIRPGDEIRLAPVEPDRVVPGMLIAYRRDARLGIHRVLARDGAGVVAKGDALVSPDAPLPWNQVVARVAALRRPTGRLVDLEAFPWPFLNRLLGGLAFLACRLCREGSREAGPPLLSRLAWKALRLPFYLARLLLR